MFYEEGKDDLVMKVKTLPWNEEKTLKKIIKDRVRKLLDVSNMIEINLSASFC